MTIYISIMHFIVSHNYFVNVKMVDFVGFDFFQKRGQRR